MAGHIMFDWDNAVIVARVPVHHTATQSIEEIPLNACQLAELISCHLIVHEDGTIGGDGKGLLVLAQETPEP